MVYFILWIVIFFCALLFLFNIINKTINIDKMKSHFLVMFFFFFFFFSFAGYGWLHIGLTDQRTSTCVRQQRKKKEKKGQSIVVVLCECLSAATKWYPSVECMVIVDRQPWKKIETRREERRATTTDFPLLLIIQL